MVRRNRLIHFVSRHDESHTSLYPHGVRPAPGNKNLRFLHVLRHVETRKEITVGIECARRLVFPEERELPQLAENETARKERWRLRYKNYGLCVTTYEDLRGKRAV